ncbi:hypothetical protein [Flavobacterium reichenbachii]|uniref:hypothetical protein n=1 Tax=Flavobacterium reichenbachii TaxID=362418 RepID=UPI000B5C0096|nr:hypothetical protein [Flavobacterium reichenbachii]OXB15970.1 hypothetical protein B0A68_06775 [Flavobacterium reichenbachii]
MNLKNTTLLAIIAFSLQTLLGVWGFYQMTKIPMGITLFNYLNYASGIFGSLCLVLFFAVLYKNQK